MPRQVFLLLVVVATLLAGCSQPRKEIKSGTIVKCSQCGAIVSRNIHTELLTEREAAGLKVTTLKGYCGKCGSIPVKVKVGKVVTCEDCGKILSRHVRMVTVALKDKTKYGVQSESALCRSCQRQRDAAAATDSDYSSDDSGNSATPSKDSAEYKLATIEAGQSIDLDDPNVGEFAQVLDSLQSKGKGSPSRNHVGDVLVRSRSLLANKGVSMGLLEFAKELDASVQGEASGKFKLEEIAAAYIVLATQ